MIPNRLGATPRSILRRNFHKRFPSSFQAKQPKTHYPVPGRFKREERE